jgi:hypothetical protein
MATMLPVAMFSTAALQIVDSGSASASPSSTSSYYEYGANSSALYGQGENAGRSGAQGIVILDFGRPAYNGTSEGTIDFASSFLSFNAIQNGVENFIEGYYQSAPANTTLDVAVGTNNSCGTGQPCEGIVCGCALEPPDFVTWGGQLAQLVEQTGSWAVSYRNAHGFTDTVRVIAADDAEPAFDPGYANTYAVLEGYANVVGGTYPPMVDYGSAEPNFWTESQLFQVAYGFPPDVPMPEIYYASQVSDWANLLAWAQAQNGQQVTIFGVLTAGAGTNSPQTAYTEILGAANRITGQQSFGWSSTINH